MGNTTNRQLCTSLRILQIHNYNRKAIRIVMPRKNCSTVSILKPEIERTRILHVKETCTVVSTALINDGMTQGPEIDFPSIIGTISHIPHIF